MKKRARNLFVILLILIFIIAFSNSYQSLSVDNLAHVIAIGVDKLDEDNLSITFQFSTTTPTSEAGFMKNTSSITDTIKASSIGNAINLMDNYMSKDMNFSHCKLIVFSEEIAVEGISDQIYTLLNDTQIRPSSNIIISKCTAKYFIEKTSPELENLISKYYEILTKSSKYTGLIPDSTIGDFFNKLVCDTCEPTAILGGPTTTVTDKQPSTNNENVKPTESPIDGQNGTETIGVAVFKKDKLVGELSASECISFLTIDKKVERFLITVPNPVDSNNYLDIYLEPEKKPKIKVSTINSSPYIQIQEKFTGRINSMSENSKALKPEVLDTISESCNKYLEAQMSEYLYKTSKKFNSDINGFGKNSLQNFFTNKQFQEYNWEQNYKNAFFKIDIQTHIKSSMLINGS